MSGKGQGNNSGWATLHVPAPFRKWLKAQATAGDVPIYKYLEDFVAKHLGKRPWDRSRKVEDTE